VISHYRGDSLPDWRDRGRLGIPGLELRTEKEEHLLLREAERKRRNKPRRESKN